MLASLTLEDSYTGKFPYGLYHPTCHCWEYASKHGSAGNDVIKGAIYRRGLLEVNEAVFYVLPTYSVADFQ